mmetsp:Transcript_76639/g.169813  ORF Transcript_76639/g.169813 Transcript_76639/m.169813 type:complete len:274 (-) Transcript_76639:924-1745(-)
MPFLGFAAAIATASSSATERSRLALTVSFAALFASEIVSFFALVASNTSAALASAMSSAWTNAADSASAFAAALSQALCATSRAYLSASKASSIPIKISARIWSSFGGTGRAGLAQSFKDGFHFSMRVISLTRSKIVFFTEVDWRLRCTALIVLGRWYLRAATPSLPTCKQSLRSRSKSCNCSGNSAARAASPALVISEQLLSTRCSFRRPLWLRKVVAKAARPESVRPEPSKFSSRSSKKSDEQLKPKFHMTSPSRPVRPAKEKCKAFRHLS